MPTKTTQIGPRLTDEALAILAALQRFYAQRAGLLEPVSQSQAFEIVLREVAKREALKIKGAK
jgi:hypothetical protein